MMTPQQSEYELDYWRKTDRAKNDARQLKILNLWGFTGADSVLEVGTGPWGGCLPFVEANRKIGTDPLYMEYAEAKLTPYPAGFQMFALDVAILPEVHGALVNLSDEQRVTQVNAVLCMNTLDHGDSDFRSIDAIARLLKPGGRFYLHVNLRTPEQLNEGHDHALSLEDLQAVIERNGLREIKCDVYDHDPVEWAPYKTVIGIWER